MEFNVGDFVFSLFLAAVSLVALVILFVVSLALYNGIGVKAVGIYVVFALLTFLYYRGLQDD